MTEEPKRYLWEGRVVSFAEFCRLVKARLVANSAMRAKNPTSPP